MKRRAIERPLYQGGICLITDRNHCRLTPCEMGLVALRAGIRWIQYRDKLRDRKSYLANAIHLRSITRKRLFHFSHIMIIGSHFCQQRVRSN